MLDAPLILDKKICIWIEIVSAHIGGGSREWYFIWMFNLALAQG